MKTERPAMMPLLALVCLILTQWMATAAGIDGNWYLEGYHAEGSPSLAEDPSRLSGTVQISISQLAFSTNLANWTDPVALTGFGSHYQFEQKDPSHDNRTTGLWKIEVIDDDTLLLSFGRVDYDTVSYYDADQGTFHDFERISGYEWISAVLTKASVPVSAAPPTIPQPWTGKHTTHVYEMTENNLRNGIGGGSRISTDRIIKSGADFRLIDDGDELVLSQTSQSSTLSASDTNTTRSLLWSDDFFEVYRLREASNWMLLHLGDGRIVAMEADSTLAEAQPVDLPTFSYEMFSDMHHRTYLFVADACAHATLVNGTVKVLRDGKEVTVLAGDPFFEKDVIFTADNSSVRLTCIDGTILTCGPNSTVEIQGYRYNTGADKMIFNLLKGALQDFATGLIKKDGVRILTKNVALGVRGTEFSLGVSESGGLLTSTVDVTGGIVDFTDLQTGATYEVLAGGTKSVTAAVAPVEVTFNAPLGGGSIMIDGALISEFPHAVTASAGTVLALAAQPQAGRVFHRWWGRNEQYSDQVAFVVIDDELVNCEFTLPRGESGVLFANALTGAGLDGGAEDSAQAMPFDDGVSNLLKWACNMNLTGPDRRSLVVGGSETAGLPGYALERIGDLTLLKMNYLRRTDGAVVYRPMLSSDLGEWGPLSSMETVVPVSAGLERVSVSIPVGEGRSARGFLRVDVMLAP